MTDNNQEDLRKKLLDIDVKRKSMEEELSAWEGVLRTSGVGPNEPLVDAEGFPRQDIDLHQIRTARNKIAHLHNDLKSLTTEMEKYLHQYHSLQRVTDADKAADR